MTLVLTSVSVGTPVIDRASGTVYLVAKSKTTTSTPSFIQRLHALDLSNGTEKLNGPTMISATAPGTGDGGGTVSFNALLNNQRCALLLAPTPNVNTGSSVFNCSETVSFIRGESFRFLNRASKTPYFKA